MYLVVVEKSEIFMYCECFKILKEHFTLRTHIKYMQEMQCGINESLAEVDILAAST